MNKFICTANLTKDPELTETPSGISVCKFSIAVSRDYTNANGEREADFFNVVVWRGRAENCAKYLKKGSKVAIVGTLQTRSYEDKDGIKRNVTEIVAESCEFLTPKSTDSQQNEEQPDTDVVSMKRERPQLTDITDDQLPF